jgi:6,7-dimethyl-8-ribityllumazine synthase
MLKLIQKRAVRAHEASIAIVASQYNAHYVSGMLQAAKVALRSAGVKHPRIVRVPGAYEIPVVAVGLARQIAEARETEAEKQASSYAIICLGVIFRGETVHAAHIGEAVSRALMEIQMRYEVPVVHEVLLLENEEQARVRCLGKTHNRGAEAAQTALVMARLMKSLRNANPPR